MLVMMPRPGNCKRRDHRASPGLLDRETCQLRIDLANQLAKLLNEEPILLQAKPIERSQRQFKPSRFVLWRHQVVALEQALQAAFGLRTLPDETLPVGHQRP